MRTTTTIACFFALALFAGSAHANLITNGGFELNGGDQSAPTGWAKDGGSYGTYNGAAHTPNTHGGSWVCVPGMGGNTTVGVYQTLASPLTAGQYTLEFWSTPWAAGNGNDVLVGVYSGSGAMDNAANWTSVALNVMDIPTVAAHSWELRSHTFTAVGGENRVYFGTAIAGNNNGADIDDVSLDLVPEPTTLTLCALGLLGLLALRRRRRR